MEEGLSTAARRKFVSIPDRKQAIKTAVSMAGPEDILLIAGKGTRKVPGYKRREAALRRQGGAAGNVRVTG
jgi:UDP-N-acetylmuramyl tripeptide synthase